MRRDITDKLSFEDKAVLVIKGEEIEVHQDAPTVLKVIGLMDDAAGPLEVMKAYEMIFPEESRKKVEKFKLGFKDLLTVVMEAMHLITNSDEEPGREAREE